jgi:predicted Zn-dependent protease
VASIRASIKADAMADLAPARPETPLDLGPATALFRARKFADAAAAFRALSASHPEDARVWYFAALAEGLSTQKWRGEVENLVTKGMGRERAGTPSAAEIDAAFAGLTSDTGKEWLAYYRSKATQR